MIESILLYLLCITVASLLVWPRSRDWLITRLQTIDDYMVEEHRLEYAPPARSPRLDPQPGDKVFYTTRDGETGRREVMWLSNFDGVPHVAWRGASGPTISEPMVDWRLDAADVWYVKPPLR